MQDQKANQIKELDQEIQIMFHMSVLKEAFLKKKEQPKNMLMIYMIKLQRTLMKLRIHLNKWKCKIKNNKRNYQTCKVL